MPASFSFDTKKKIYLDAKGKAISPAKIRGYIEQARANGKAKIQALAQQYADGKITLPSFVTQARPLYVGAHSAAAQIAAGGRAQMTSQLNGRLGARVKFIDEKFKGFWLEIEKGEQLSTGIVDRAGKYLDSIVGTYENMRRGVMIDGGMTEEMRTLGKSNNCSDCPPLAGEWQPIGTLPEIGSTECLSACGCWFEYR